MFVNYTVEQVVLTERGYDKTEIARNSVNVYCTLYERIYCYENILLDTTRGSLFSLKNSHARGETHELAQPSSRKTARKHARQYTISFSLEYLEERSAIAYFVHCITNTWKFKLKCIAKYYMTYFILSVKML